MSTTTNQGLRVKEGKTKLIVPHHGNNLIFLYQSYGPDTYAKVGSKIEENGLARATMDETASLVHGVFNSDDKYSKGIKEIMKDYWLWVFTGSLYTPGGVYIQDNPKIRDGMPFMEESELVRRLNASDPSVRFVPYGFKTGIQSASELAENSYLIGLAGKEGAKKLGEVADKHNFKPCLWSLESVDQPTTRVSALVSGWYFDRRLVVGGRGGRGGRAFGVLK